MPSFRYPRHVILSLIICACALPALAGTDVFVCTLGLTVNPPGYTNYGASGGIRAHAQALALLEAGADLLGTSAAPAIADGAEAAGSGY